MEVYGLANKYNKESIFMKQKTQRILSVLLVAFLLLSAMSFGVVSASAETVTPTADWPVKGTGAEADPYLIESEADWLAFVADFTKTSGKYVSLTKDLDFNPGWDAESNVAATNSYCFSANVGFAGTFNGNGHTVSGLCVTGSTTSGSSGRAGIFGVQIATNATIKNLVILNSKVSGTQYVGGLYGLATKKQKTLNFENLYLEIAVSSTAAPADGSKDGFVGGLVGDVGTDATNAAVLNIKNVVFAGSVTTIPTIRYIGAFIGRVSKNSTICSDVNITNSIFCGTMTTSADTSCGLIGYIQESVSGKLQNSIVLGKIDVTTSTNKQSGIIGFTATVQSNFAVDHFLYTAAKVDGTDNAALCSNSGKFTAGEQTVNINAPEDALAATKMLADHSMSGWKVTVDGTPLPASVYKMLYSDGTVNLVGYQTTAVEDGTYSVRLVGVLSLGETELTDYDGVGFTYRLQYTQDSVTKQTDAADYQTSSVFTSLLAMEEGGTVTYTASALGGDDLFALTFAGLPVAAGNMTIEVTPFYVLAGSTEKTTGSTHTFTVAVPNL